MVWNSGDSEKGVGWVVWCWGRYFGFRCEWMGTELPLGEEGDRRSLEQCEWVDWGALGSGRAELGKGCFGGHTATVRRHRKEPDSEQAGTHIPLHGQHNAGFRDASSTSAFPRAGYSWRGVLS